MMTPVARNPEELAREQIDAQLADCGCIVQDRRAMNISAGAGVAIREFPLLSGEADYLLYANGRAIATIEAKPEEHPLIGVEEQSGKFTDEYPVQRLTRNTIDPAMARNWRRSTG